jgi:general secretion pathway protein D
MKILLIFILLSSHAFCSILTQDANGNFLLKNSEFDFSKLISDYSKITKKNLIIGSDVKGKAFLYGVKKIKKEEIDLYISAVASQAGYTILSNTELNQIEVINSRDIRYRSTKLYTDINNVPDNYNHVQFIMKLKYIEARDISRNFRPFMSRYGRIIDERHANTLVISDTGKNVNRLYKLAKALDTKAYVDRKDFIKKINDNAKKEIIKKESVLDFIQNQHVLFLIVFCFIGGFLGFGIRGYMMKKIEGGW